jgi:branched-chain amino acid transport system substrate-binding protein
LDTHKEERSNKMKTRGTKRWLAVWLTALVAVAALAGAGCGDDDDDDGGGGGDGGGSSSSGGSKAPGGTIKVGTIGSLAGIGGVFAGFQAGVQGYFEYYNSQDGIDGTQVEFVQVDDGGDPGKAAAGARKLVTQDKVLAIVGMASLADAAVAKYLNSAGVPVVGGWATSSSWHDPNDNMFVSLEGPNKPYCTVWSNTLAKAEGVTSTSYIAQDFPAATGDADCRATAGEKVGIKKAGDRIDVALTAADYRPAMQRAIGTGADGIYFSTGTDGQLKGIQAGEQLGYEGKYIPTQPAGLEQGLASIAGSLDGRVLTSGFSVLPSDPDSVSEELAAFKKGMAEFQPKFANEITAVSGWAAGRMFADALKAAGDDQEAIIEYLSGVKDYTFGDLQGPMDWSNGSVPNPCVANLVMNGGKFGHPEGTEPGEWDCTPLINWDTGATEVFPQYEKNIEDAQ